MKKITLLMILLMGAFLLNACTSPNAKFPFAPLKPAVLAAGAENQSIPAPPNNSCKVYAADLIGAWDLAKTPEKDPFRFKDIDGKDCEGTFTNDVLPIFTTPNLWYAGALSCRTCHGPEMMISYAQMNLSDYGGIMAGSRVIPPATKGDSIMDPDDWKKSVLFTQIDSLRMPPGSPPGQNPKGPLLEAGTQK